MPRRNSRAAPRSRRDAGLEAIAMAQEAAGGGPALRSGPTPKRGNKFGAQKVDLDGHRFDSKAEASRWSHLRILERAGEIINLRRQVAYPLTGRDWSTICTYVADFVYQTPTGEVVVEDVKGQRTEAYRLKAKLFLATYGFSIREIEAWSIKKKAHPKGADPKKQTPRKPPSKASRRRAR